MATPSNRSASAAFATSTPLASLSTEIASCPLSWPRSTPMTTMTTRAAVPHMAVTGRGPNLNLSHQPSILVSMGPPAASYVLTVSSRKGGALHVPGRSYPELLAVSSTLGSTPVLRVLVQHIGDTTA